ncbi:hypothetical protein LRAMOSA02947 [Lichtheimia ramosa]|uniref:LIM zinc-binding domain-containing protein n=1 Tax=Lichtheimia ramosa TaxID=688394 RepID=A0A077WRM4_9FUNG|nr:hypothetical protein LRAMOSA02947 [Lichtheimia ramosa]
MMCCNRCGDILSSGKCRKCGGRAVASIIASSGMGSVRAISTTASEENNNQISIADKWQSQYENGILGSSHTVFDAKEKPQSPSYPKNSTSSGTLRSRRNSSPQGLMSKRNSLSLSLQNSCAQCNQRLRYDTPSFLENGTRYCKNCHTDLFSKGNCSKCKKAVFPQRDTFIEHKTSVWHRDCFRCHGCLVALADVPMVDLRGRPCCEPCLMAQSGEARQSSTRQVYDIAKLHHPKPESNNNSTTGTPILVKGSDTMSSAGSIFGTPKTPPNSRPRIDSQLFHHYQKTLQRDNANANSPPPPPLSPAGSIRSSISGSPLSISPSSSPLSFQSSSSSSTSRMNNASPVNATTQSPPTSARVSRRTMPSPVPTSSESTSTTKNGRRMCAECSKPLQGTKVKMPSPSGDIWYHYDCLKCARCRGHFTESKIVRLGNTIYHPECLPPSEPAEEQQLYKCHTCQSSIKDKCVRNGSKYYHIDCFQCRKCHKVLDHSQPFYEVQNEPHCESCVNHTNPSPSSNNGPPTPRPTPSHRMRGSTSTPLLPSHRNFDNNPSSLLRHRTRALPKLGGSVICPRCNASTDIMDRTRGPNNTYWHRKCLRCVSCKKQMDSDAKARENENGEPYVQCRGCRDKTGSTPKFVR